MHETATVKENAMGIEFLISRLIHMTFM